MREPIVIVVDLPLPPSVNRIWQRNKAGKKKVSRSPAYTRWIKAADALVMATGAHKGVKTIRGPFNALIELSRAKLSEIGGDPDNRVKAILDYAQRIALIANDRNAEETRVRKADHENCPYGARLTLTEVIT